MKAGVLLQEITINKNEHNQRMDKFIKKYLPKASAGFIYKMLRKKRIKLNNNRANPENILKEGDKIQLYLSTETLCKFQEDKRIHNVSVNFDIVYEDSNILLVNKPKNVLSHPSKQKDENTVVNQIVSYLYDKGEYKPNDEKTFIPSICNRLDRNTSGIIIAGKNYASLQVINEAIRKGELKKIYKCIVKGKIEESRMLRGYLVKNPKNNAVKITNKEQKDSKPIHTYMKPIKYSEEYTLLEIDLITGRTHQIRAHLAHIGHPIIGDIKYGDKKINNLFRTKYQLNSQFLHAYKIIFNSLKEPLEYLNNKEFVAEMNKKLQKIVRDLFK